MSGAAQRVDSHEQQLAFLTKAMVGPSFEQELITVIKEETKRTEEKEEAWYRLPTWSILRAAEHCKRSTKPRDLKARQ